MTEAFDFNKALKAIQSGQAISGKDGVLAPLLKQLTEAALEAELESHIADDVVPNRKNGKSRKTLKTSEGRIDLDTPRDRAGTFEPQIIKKHQTSVSDEIETKIMSMYGRGMSYSDISEHVHEIYGISVSAAAISATPTRLLIPSRPGSSARWILIIPLSGWTPSITRCGPKGVIKVAPFTPFWGLILKAKKKCWAYTCPRARAPTSGWAC